MFNASRLTLLEVIKGTTWAVVFHKLCQEIVLIVSVSESYNKIIGKYLPLFHIRGNLYIYILLEGRKTRRRNCIVESFEKKKKKKRKLIFSQNSSGKKGKKLKAKNKISYPRKSSSKNSINFSHNKTSKKLFPSKLRKFQESSHKRINFRF